MPYDPDCNETQPKVVLRILLSVVGPWRLHREACSFFCAVVGPSYASRIASRQCDVEQAGAMIAKGVAERAAAFAATTMGGNVFHRSLYDPILVAWQH